MLQELAASFWFRSLLPLAVGLIYELGTRYAGKGESSFGQEDWFIAIPAMGTAIIALPPLTALRASDMVHAHQPGNPTEIIALCGFMIAALVMAAFIMTALDRRVLAPRRRRGKFWKGVLLTWVPNIVGISLAVAFLGIVGQ